MRTRWRDTIKKACDEIKAHEVSMEIRLIDDEFLLYIRFRYSLELYGSTSDEDELNIMIDNALSYVKSLL